MEKKNRHQRACVMIVTQFWFNLAQRTSCSDCLFKTTTGNKQE